MRPHGGVAGDWDLAVLVELAAEGHSEVGRTARGVVAGEQILVVVEGGASALAYVHVLEAGLDTARYRHGVTQGGRLVVMLV